MKKLKTIRYRGGIACFEIPISWIEENDPPGGAIFYEDNPDSATLRLNVLGFSSNGKETGDQMVSGLIAKNGYQELHDGLAFKENVKSVEENGEELQIHYWEIAVPVEGGNLRLAIFSYTILALQATDEKFEQEIALLRRCIKEGEYSREQGMSSDYKEE